MKQYLKKLCSLFVVLCMLSGTCFVVLATEATDSSPEMLTSSAESTPVSSELGNETSSEYIPDAESSHDETSSNETSSDEASSNGTPSDETSSNETSSNETSSDETSSNETSSDETSSDETSSNETSSNETSSDETSSNETSSDETSSDETSSNETSSNETSSDETSSDETSSDESSGKEPIPDAFFVFYKEIDITRSFQKNGHTVTGKIDHSVNSITVTIAEYGESKTVTFEFTPEDGVTMSNGVHYAFSMQIVHEISGRPVTDHYQINVVQSLDPALMSSSVSSTPSSKPTSSEDLPPVSSEISSEVSSEASSAVSSELQNSQQNSSSAAESVHSSQIMGGTTSSASSDSASSQTSSAPANTQGRIGWLLPLAIVFIIIGVAGIIYVLLETLRMRGISVFAFFRRKEDVESEDADALPEGYADLLNASQDTGTQTTENAKDTEADQVDLDAFFKS